MIATPGGATDEFLDLGERWLLRSQADRSGWLSVGYRLSKQNLARRKSTARIASIVANRVHGDRRRRSIALELWLNIAELSDEKPDGSLISDLLLAADAADEDIVILWLVAMRLDQPAAKSPETVAKIDRWLEVTLPSHEHYELALLALWENPLQTKRMKLRLAGLALTWLKQNKEHPQAPSIWWRLVKLKLDEPLKSEVINFGHEWLLEHTQAIWDWPYVWSGLLATAPTLCCSDALTAAALRWLDLTGANMPYRKRIARHYKKTPSNIDGSEIAKPAPPPIRLVHAAALPDGDLVINAGYEAAFEWIKDAAPTSSHWPGVWTQAIVAAQTLEQFLEILAILDGWLEHRLVSDDWLCLWGARIALLEDDPTRSDALMSLGDTWSRDNPTLDSGGLIDWYLTVEKFRRQLRVLDDQSSEWASTFLCLAKMDGVRGAPELLTRAGEVRGSHSGKNWDMVAEEVRRLKLASDFKPTTGFSALHDLATGTRVKGWTERWYVGLQTQMRELRPSFEAAALKRLAKPTLPADTWQFLWFRCWLNCPARASELKALAQTWLAAAPRPDIYVKGIEKRINRGGKA